MNNVHINSFVKRQTSVSEFSHYDGELEDVASMVEANFFHAKAGYRDGVILVSVPSNNFYSGVVELSEGDELKGSFKARRQGEEPRKSVVAAGAHKMPAKGVEVVLYASTVLSEDGDNELEPVEGNWEVISINANPEEGEMPISPEVLMHNHFGSDGGTATGMTDEELVAQLRVSFEFWKNKAMAAGK